MIKKIELKNQHNTLTRASYSISSETIATSANKSSIGVRATSILRAIVVSASKTFIDVCERKVYEQVDSFRYQTQFVISAKDLLSLLINLIIGIEQLYNDCD